MIKEKFKLRKYIELNKKFLKNIKFREYRKDYIIKSNISDIKKMNENQIIEFLNYIDQMMIKYEIND